MKKRISFIFLLLILFLMGCSKTITEGGDVIYSLEIKNGTIEKIKSGLNTTGELIKGGVEIASVYGNKSIEFIKDMNLSK